MRPSVGSFDRRAVLYPTLSKGPRGGQSSRQTRTKSNQRNRQEATKNPNTESAKRLGQMATLTPPSRISPDHPTHYEPSDSVPGRLSSAGRPAADFGTASPCGWPLVWTPAGDAILVFAGQPMQRKCTTPTPTTTSSGCCLRRRSHVLVGFPDALSIGRLHAASFGRHGFAIGSAFHRRSWSAGSMSGSSCRSLAR
jgi:hypothetical protein